MEPNAYECPDCGADVEATTAVRPCPDCGVLLVLDPDAETVWRGESVKVIDNTRWTRQEF